MLTLLAPAQAGAADPEGRLLVFGDSFAVGTEPYMPKALPAWRVKQDVAVNRRARHAVRALRKRKRIPRVIHISLGTVDDPGRRRAFRRSVRRTMRIVGPRRCVVWTNIFRPSREGEPSWERLNRVLAREAGARDNLVIVDWFTMVQENPEWLRPEDGTHVTKRGYRQRARAVADGARECRDRLAQ